MIVRYENESREKNVHVERGYALRMKQGERCICALGVSADKRRAVRDKLMIDALPVA